MKNMLSKLGTKKVAGALLAAATVLVGVGVVSNFSGGGQREANDAALSRFSDSAYNNFSGSAASRAALERRMNAGQDMNTARFLRGKDGGMEDEAYSSDGAYAEGMRGDEGFVYGAYEGGAGGVNGADRVASADGAYQPFNSTYDVEEGGMDPSVLTGAKEYGAQQFQEIQQQASAAVGAGAKGIASQIAGAKGAAGANGKSSVAEGGNSNVAGVGTLRPATQVNKLASSNGGGSSFGGGTGGAKGGGSSSSGGASVKGDNNTRALPKNGEAQGADGAKAFQLGRGGTMGGFQTGKNGNSKEGRGKGGGDSSVANSLLRASRLSSKATATKETEGAKNLADAAFDGQEEDAGTGATIGAGATVGRVANALKSASSSNSFNSSDLNSKDPFKEIESQMEALQELNKDIRIKYRWTLIWTIAIGLLAASALTGGALGGGLTGPIIGPGAAVFIMIWGYNMINRRVGLEGVFRHEIGPSSIIGMIQQMGDSSKFGLVNESIDIPARISQAMWFGNFMKGALWAFMFGGATFGVAHILSKAKSLNGIFRGIKNDDFNDESGEYSKYDRFLGKAEEFVENKIDKE